MIGRWLVRAVRRQRKFVQVWRHELELFHEREELALHQLVIGAVADKLQREGIYPRVEAHREFQFGWGPVGDALDDTQGVEHAGLKAVGEGDRIAGVPGKRSDGFNVLCHEYAL